MQNFTKLSSGPCSTTPPPWFCQKPIHIRDNAHGAHLFPFIACRLKWHAISIEAISHWLFFWHNGSKIFMNKCYIFEIWISQLSFEFTIYLFGMSSDDLVIIKLWDLILNIGFDLCFQLLKLEKNSLIGQ